MSVVGFVQLRCLTSLCSSSVCNLTTGKSTCHILRCEAAVTLLGARLLCALLTRRTYQLLGG